MDVKELVDPVALRVFVDDEDLDNGVVMLLKRRRDLKITPFTISFNFSEGEWEIILSGEK